MNSVQTVTLNSALSQNWVGCTVRTPRTQVARAVPISWALLLAQQACRAQPAQVARMLGVHLSRHAQAACPQVATSLRCRDIKAASIMSRHLIDVATPSRPLHVATSIGVATSFLYPHRCPYRDIIRDIKMMSRHQALPSHCHPCRDILFMSRHQACSAKASQVATSLLGRDLYMSRPPN